MKRNGVKKHITKVASYTAVGSIGLLMMSAMTGCEHRQEADTMVSQNQAQGYFIVIQQTGSESYKIVEQYPTPGTTRAILKKLDGTEQLLNEEELKALSSAEAQKVEEGTSRLTQPAEAGNGGGGMGLGEVILASAAGAIIGSWLGNKLFNNPNYQQRASKAPSSYSPKTTAPANAAKTAPKKSGYMQSSPRKSSFRFGG